VLAGGVTVLNHLRGWMNGPLVEIRKPCWRDGTYWVEVSGQPFASHPAGDCKFSAGLR